MAGFGNYEVDPNTGRPIITINPQGGGGQGGAGLTPFMPAEPTPPQQTGPTAPAGLTPFTPGEQKEPAPDEGAMVAAGRGAIEAGTFGTAPAIAGLSAASGMQPANPEASPSDTTGEATAYGNIAGAIASPFVGAYKLATGAPGASDAYTQARERALEQEQQSQEQHPYAYTGGQVGAIAATLPFTGGAGAATTMGRIAQGAKAGAIGGGAFGAGTAISEGQGPLEVAKQGGLGAVVGGVVGGAGTSAVEGATHLGRRVASVVRGARNPDAEAARIVQQGVHEGRQTAQQNLADQGAIDAGRQAGTPTAIVDYAGAPTQRRLRSAVNISSEAAEHVGGYVGQRFEQQNERIANWIRSRFGAHGGRDVDSEMLRQASRRANAPAYRRAYLVGDRRFPNGVWSDRLEQLLSSNSVPQALEEAITKGRDRAVLEGQGAFNPRVTFENGIMRSNRRGGAPAFPDMQLWDYAQRALRDKAQHLTQQGYRDEGGALFGLHAQLLEELDHLVPEFGAARGTAHAFFHADDMLEAGFNFVTDNAISDTGAARMVARMNGPDRALFARGFAMRLAEQIERTSYNRNVLNTIFVNSPRAAQRIEIALGQHGAAEFEALMRVEEMVDRTRRALGNSTTAQQQTDRGLIAGAGAVGAEALHGVLNPVYIIAGGLLIGAQHTARQIDQQVALRVAQMLTSRDPTVLQRGYAVVARNPVLRDALRRASDIGTRELINVAGPTSVLAGAGAAYQHFRPSEMPHEPSANYGQDDQQTGPIQ